MDLPSLTDQCALPNCEELVPLQAPWDMASPWWFSGRSSSTLSLCPHGSWDVVGARPMLKIQQSAVTSRILRSNFYLNACL